MTPPTNERKAQDENADNAATASTSTSIKHILAIRHAQSIANEQLLHRWGAADFTDDVSLRDSELSAKGLTQVQQGLPAQLSEPDFAEELSKIELVLVSPLTRCLQTFTFGVLPQIKNKQIPILALPELTERVYTVSDTGSPTSVLNEKFPQVDFSNLHGSEGKCWWYTEEDSEDPVGGHCTREEWRPCNENQWYAVPGEPGEIFESRMTRLDKWIQGRPESNILVVAHWGVLRHLTGGVEWRNAEAKLLEWKSDEPHAKVLLQTGEPLRSKFAETSKI